MQDNRWLYFVVGGLLVVAVVFGVFYYNGRAPSGGSTQVQTTTQPAPAAPGAGSSGSAAGSSSGSGSSTSVTIEQKKQ